MDIQQQIRQHLTESSPETSEAREEFLYTLGYLQALERLYYHLHWKAKGEPFYGDHLLFERLYEGLDDEYDVLAEKILSYFPARHLELMDQLDRMTDVAGVWVRENDNLLGAAIQAEEHLQDWLDTLYENLTRRDDMSLGLDDFIMAMANDHEENLYLLRQRNQT